MFSSSTSASATFTSNATVTHNLSMGGTDDNGCSATVAFQVKVNACTGIEENVAGTVRVFPNPSNGEFRVLGAGAAHIKVMNALGQEVRSVTLDEGNGFEARVDGLANGVYFLVGDRHDGAYRVVVNK